MQRNGLGDLPLEIYEQILTMMCLDDVLDLRRLCRRIGFVASVVADRFICFPFAEQFLNAHNWHLSKKRSQNRTRAYAVLSKPYVAVRRCTLTGPGDIYDKFITEPGDYSETQASVLADALRDASNLQYLTVHLHYSIVLPILRRLAQWPKLRRLDIPVSTTSFFLEGSHLRCLTLRLKPQCGALNKIPALPLLSRLKIEGIWPAGEWDLPTNARLDLTQYPQLTWFKVCGNAPNQFLDIFNGRTTSIKRCIIGNARDVQQSYELEFFEQRALNFFSCFATGLEALIIHSGKFDPVTNVFPKLRSLKLPVDIPYAMVEGIRIRNCPQLVQLSLISRELPSPGQVSSLATSLVPLYASTLQSLQLVKDPYNYYQRESSRLLEELSTDAIHELALSKHIKFLEVSGFLYVSKQNAETFGREHTELEAVMLTYPAFGGFYEKSELRRLLTPHLIPGLKRVGLPIGLPGDCSLPNKSTSLQVSRLSAAWNDFDCQCGWTQRTQFARRMDPHCLFVDDDDDDAAEMRIDAGPCFKDHDSTQHRIRDTKSIGDIVRPNRKRAKQDEGRGVAPAVQPHKRRKKVQGEPFPSLVPPQPTY